MTPGEIRALALASAAAAALLGGAAFWLYRGERRKAKGFRARVRDRLHKAAKRRG